MRKAKLLPLLQQPARQQKRNILLPPFFLNRKGSRLSFRFFLFYLTVIVLMRDTMHLVVGLGNPGKTYEQTRHNIGFMVLDYIAEKEGFAFTDSKWEAKVAKVSFGRRHTLFVKPQTFMNNSGRAVGKICSYYKIVPENIIVIHDDLDLEFGRIKLVVNRGAGGHNGITSIIQHLGGKNFARIRAGIGRPVVKNGMPVSGFVLANFSSAEQATLDGLLTSIAVAVRLILEQGAIETMNLINRQ